MLDKNRQMVSALDLFFLQADGSRFKATLVCPPYLLIRPRKEFIHEVTNYLQKKYGEHLSALDVVTKEDLDMPNHLIGLTQTYLKLSFRNMNKLTQVKRELANIVKKNDEQEANTTSYKKMLHHALVPHATEGASKHVDVVKHILDMREHDLPYHVRVSIDEKIFCGLWYNVRGMGAEKNPQVVARPDILDLPDFVVLAYDIETTKLPLKFPDAQSDQIMMISYMIDGQGYLITNREIVSRDVADFEFTPKPEFEGNFIVFNEADERALIQRFLDHILDVRPHIFVSYNGDFFDWPFVETRAAIYNFNLTAEIGFYKHSTGYLCRPALHLDCFYWVKRDSYLPMGSQGLKAVAKAKLRYDPVEMDPEDMCKMAVEQPQVMANYSVSDAVATYYLYLKYVHPFTFALATIIPLEPDEILRKGSGTLCECILMVRAFHSNVVFPNKQQTLLNKMSDDGHILDSETYIGGHVEALESGVFRADIPCRFRVDKEMVRTLKGNLDQVLAHAIEVEEGIPMADVTNLDEVKAYIAGRLDDLEETPNRLENPVIYHLDVGAMYPNIILTNRLQPYSIVDETDCAVCDFNYPDAVCKRKMQWAWRGEMLPASRSEYQRIQQQLETEKFPPMFPNGPVRAFHELSLVDQAEYEKKRLTDYCRKTYKKTKVTRVDNKESIICQKENSFYVDTVRSFRDRRYDYKMLTKRAKAEVAQAVATGDASEIKAAKGKEVIYDSLQLAHKCILNSFYGYVMRRGARWHSMPMAGIVCLTGANIIRKAREIVERIGRPLELDTDGIWCILPGTFPQNLEIQTRDAKKRKLNISYPNAILNAMVKDHFTNDQYHEMVRAGGGEGGVHPVYEKRDENSIFFEVDGPYLAMILPAAKEEGKKLKKRYAVFNFDGTLAELKGFEVKRRGELQLIKIFQSSVFEAFLHGASLEECYASVAKIADYWLDVLYSKGMNMPDDELFDLISEKRSMSKKLEEYGDQKSTSISTAKRLAEFLGDQMIKDVGLQCKYIISEKPNGAPVTERAVPMAIFQSEPSVRRHFMRRWLKDSNMGDADIRQVIDWNYYIERLNGTIMKIITIPAALQGVSNPVPRVQHPEWLHKRVLQKNDTFKQRRINDLFTAAPKKPLERDGEVGDIEDMAGEGGSGGGPSGRSVVVRKRMRSNSPTESVAPQAVPSVYAVQENSREELCQWVDSLRKRWSVQRENKSRRTRNDKRAKTRTNDPSAVTSDATVSNARSLQTIGGFVRRSQRNLIEQTWQVVQLCPSDDFGNFVLWVVVHEELHKIKLVVPRIFYVNQRTALVEDGSNVYKKVSRILPRSRPVFHLYQYVISEQLFKEQNLGLIADLTTPNIEGIYETQVSLEFRALMELGCLCAVQTSHVKGLLAKGAQNVNSFSIQQLEAKTAQQSQGYLQEHAFLRKVFVYHHSMGVGKREMWGIFMPEIAKAVVLVYDTVRTDQMPQLKQLYRNECKVFLENNAGEGEGEEDSPALVEHMEFETIFETSQKNLYRQIQKVLTGYRERKKNPTVVCVQTTSKLAFLTAHIPLLTEFPCVQIHITDELSLLYGLDWQRIGSRTMIRHYLNLESVFKLMVSQCEYLHVPVGNLPADSSLFGVDLFYARYLQKHNFVLWYSPTKRPDFGGHEDDDNRLLSEFEDSYLQTAQNKAGFYAPFCVTLSVEGLAVSALLQMNKIRELDGNASVVAFDVMPQASSLDTIANSTGQLPNYDETTLCSGAFRIMRSMVTAWLRQVSTQRNKFSDVQIMNFYRWIKSSNALLYDPALRRTLNSLVCKFFFHLVAEFQRLGTDIIYADYNKIVLNTGKRSTMDAMNYVDYLVQSIRNREMFHSIQLIYQKSWKHLLWYDPANYGGFLINLEGDTEDLDQTELEINFSLLKHGDERCQEEMEEAVTKYMRVLSQQIEPAEAIRLLTEHAFEVVQRLHKGHPMGSRSPALDFITSLHKVLAVDKSIQEEVSGRLGGGGKGVCG